MAVLLAHLVGGATLVLTADRWPVPWTDPGVLVTVPTADALAIAVRAGLALALAWSAATVPMVAIARLPRLPRGVRSAVRRCCLPLTRRSLERVAAVALSTALPLPAAAVAAPLPPALQRPGDGHAGSDGPPVTAAPRPDAATITVAPGDSFWSLAAAEVGPDASPRVVVPVWRRLIAANRDRIRSGDPDLIHPGERLVRPDLSP